MEAQAAQPCPSPANPVTVLSKQSGAVATAHREEGSLPDGLTKRGLGHPATIPPQHRVVLPGVERGTGLVRTAGWSSLHHAVYQRRCSLREEEKRAGHWDTTVLCPCSIRPHHSPCNALLLPAEPPAGPAGAGLPPPRQRTCPFASAGSGMWWGRSAGVCEHRRMAGRSQQLATQGLTRVGNHPAVSIQLSL